MRLEKEPFDIQTAIAKEYRLSISLQGIVTPLTLIHWNSIEIQLVGRIRSKSGQMYFKMRLISLKKFHFEIPNASALKWHAIPYIYIKYHFNDYSIKIRYKFYLWTEYAQNKEKDTSKCNELEGKYFVSLFRPQVTQICNQSILCRWNETENDVNLLKLNINWIFISIVMPIFFFRQHLDERRIYSKFFHFHFIPPTRAQTPPQSLNSIEWNYDTTEFGPLKFKRNLNSFIKINNLTWLTNCIDRTLLRQPTDSTPTTKWTLFYKLP